MVTSIANQINTLTPAGTIRNMALINYLRAVLVLLVVVPVSTLITIFWVVVGILLFRVSTSRIKAAPRWWSRVIARAFGVEVEVEGLENLEPEHPYILAANHQSQFDIFALDGYLMVDFRWMAKKELFRIPLVGWSMRLAGSIPIDRSHGRQAMKSLAEAAERIASGTSVVIFPEGTRTRDGNLQPFKAGGMYLAIKSGVKVAPVALTGGFDVLPKGKILPRPGRIRIRVGRPVATAEFSQKQKKGLADLLHDRVAALM